MPFPNVPSEIRDLFSRIYEGLKKKYPKYSKEKLAKLTYYVIKKTHYKGKDGKWHKREKYAAWLFDDRNIDALASMVSDLVELQPETNLEDNKMDPKNIITINSMAKIISATEAAAIEIPPDTLDWKSKLLERAGFDFQKVGDKLEDADYLYVDNWMCHADVPNENKAEFSVADLQAIVERGGLSPYTPVIVDVNHSEVPMVGLVLAGVVMQDEDTPNKDMGLRVLSVLLNWGPYKEAGRKIIETHEKGQLVFSMSCIPEYCSCKKCGHLSRSRYDSCEHVADSADKEGILMIHHPKFLTNSIILPPLQPADKDAKTNELTRGEYSESTITILTEDQMDELEKMKNLVASLEAELKTFKEADQEQLAEHNKVLTAKVAELDAKVSELTTQVASLETTNKELADSKKALEDNLRARDEAEAKAKEATRTSELSALGLEFTDAEKAYFESKAKTEDDASWGILVATLKKQTVTPADDKLNASKLLGGIVGGGGADSKPLSGLKAQVAKNV
jgi:hypothetical protein